MNEVWVKAVPWNKEVVINALESGADAVIVEKGYSPEVKKLGRIRTVAEDGDIVPGKDVAMVDITSKKDEEKILALPSAMTVIVKTADWTIIPLENILAQRKNIFLEVSSLEDAMTATGILERGVDGIVLDCQDSLKIRSIVSRLKQGSETLELAEAEVTRVLSLDMGDRVCIDTCTDMHEGQGMLIGNSSGGLFLVHAETVENPYVAPRPFRVNAGPIHAYARVPGGKTRYLSEFRSGDSVLIVNHDGTTETGVVGRVKVEKRPLVFVEAVVDGTPYSTILQNAETIRLTSVQGAPISVVELREQSRVLMFTETCGRHFGIKVNETIDEK